MIMSRTVFCCCVYVLVEVGVAADNGSNDLSLLTESLIEGHTRAYNAFPQFRLIVSFFFAADVGEELINVVNYS